MIYSEIEKEIRTKFSFNYSRKNYDDFLLSNNINFKFKAVHITGTNGKTSTTKYIYEILKDANYKVGIFTSPYFYNLRETIVYDGTEISEEEFSDLYLQYRESFLKFKLTEFEIVTFICFKFFENKNVDVAVIECGMGGALDATNIFTPILSIITSVAIEHTFYLGNSVTDIAKHKVGIFKKDIDALVGDLDEEALGVVKKACKNIKCPLTLVKTKIDFEKRNNCIIFNYENLENIILKTEASYQVKNACIAIEASFILRKFFNISDENIRNGLLQIPYQFRFEKFSPNIILDGAHNVEAIQHLVKELSNEKRKIHIIFASFKDKNIETILPSLSSLTEDLRLTQFPHIRCRTKENYFLYLDDFKYYENFQQCYDEIKENFPNDLILFTGSLAFCAYVKRNLKQ